MKILHCHALGQPEDLTLSHVPVPQPGPDQVLIKVAVCGVNFPDVLIIQGKYQVRPPLPFAPGGEVSGTVAALGQGVQGWEVGQRVFAAVGWGGFAEYAIAPADQLIALPDGISNETAAVATITYGTAMHALKDRANLQPGENLVVLGAAGGVGMATIELGVLMGARVIAAASSDEKLAHCTQAGAHATINYEKDDLKEAIKALTQGKGADVLMDPVGGKYTHQAVRAMAYRGRYLVVGFAAGEIPQIPLNLPLLKAFDLVGVYWSSFRHLQPGEHQQNMAMLSQWFLNGQLKPFIQEKFTLENGGKAIRLLMDRRVTGKVVVTP
jgi:NADPH2:quinone reductase